MEREVQGVAGGNDIFSSPQRTLIMGVLNVTPDSFSDGGKFLDPSSAVEHAERMAEEGADIIDIGGESSRPGSKRISVQEEIDRVLPVILALKGRVNIPISIDTYKAEVAQQAVAEGVSIVNDITALNGDAGMSEVVASSGIYAVLMHMKGTPENMQASPSYDDVVDEVCTYLAGAAKKAEEAGVARDRIIVDPGIGFGKTQEHNLKILKGLEQLKALGYPVLVGTSRKSFIGTITGKEVEARDFGTAASVAISVMNGADIVRVHDIDKMADVIRVADAIRRV